MTWNEFYNYLTAMIVMAAITIGFIVYSIQKNNYSKKNNGIILGILILDAVLLVVIFIKLWF
jgi:hypothetical protein